MTDNSPDTDQSLIHARLAAIVDSSFDAIIGKDLDGTITDWNRAAERLFGYTAAEAVGSSILMLIPDHLRSEESDILARLRNGEQINSYETTRRRKDGTFASVSLTISPIRDGTGTIIGASKIARDITGAKERDRRIHLLLREVNHRVKNQFAVILSIIAETSRRATKPQEFEEQVRDRIMALSLSHDLLVDADWTGASIVDLIQEHLRPFGHEEQITLAGPLVTLHPNSVQNFGMAFHELATNSSKFGALSSNVGTVSIKWSIEHDQDGKRHFVLNWEEASQSPSPMSQNVREYRDGFGNVVLQRVAPQSLGGTAKLDCSPGRLRWTLKAPVDVALSLPLHEQLAP